MESISQSTQENQLSIIRTETVFSRLPVHTLSKKGDISISITRRNDEGETELYWEVSPSKNHGAPRQLAYRLDTLVINQRLEGEGGHIPKIVKLGSVRQLRQELGSKEKDVKRALRQNAGALLTIKLNYKGKDGTERYIDGTFTRYSVIFTGERLPDGRKSDAVYIILNDIYREVLNNAPVRPLNYDYLKQLPPAAQRFYEIISYRIYGAIKHNQDYATFPYSEFCTCSGLTRYYDRDKVKKQMYKVHRPHIKSGYIEKVSYESIVDSEGNNDWTMRYAIGAKARHEYKVFTSKHLRKASEANDTLTGLAKELYERGIRPASKAKELASEHQTETINEKLEMYNTGIIKEAGGLLHAIENDWQPTDAQLKDKAKAEAESVLEKIRQLTLTKDQLKETYEEQCESIFQNIIAAHPDTTHETMQEVATISPFMAQFFDNSKPFAEQGAMIQGMTKPKLREKFLDAFQSVDEDYQQKIKPIDAQIEALQNERTKQE